MERTSQNRVERPDGSWLTVDTYGSPGEPGLLIVPGVMSDAGSWRPIALAAGAWPSISVVNRRGREPSGPLGSGYSVHTEVHDLSAVLDEMGEPAALFGWSYGGLIALLLASERPIEHVIAYEPVAPGFGRAALPSLRAAHDAEDWDRSVEIVNVDVSGFSGQHVQALRADRWAWSTLRRLSEPLSTELSALSATDMGDGLGAQAATIDLIIGEKNVAAQPYGASFQQVASRLQDATVHRLVGQGHLAHVDDPALLARFLNGLAR